MHRNINSLSKKIHPYNNYLESGKLGLEIFEDLTKKYNVDLSSEVYRKGITYFLNILNYSIFSIYSKPAAYSSNQRIKLLRFVSLINKKHQIAYRPENVKNKIVKNILRINLKFADKFLLIIFALSLRIKNLTRN